MRLIDADELKKCAIPCEIHNGTLTDLCVPLYQIDNAPTVELHMGRMTNGIVIPIERPHGKWYRTGQSFINPDKFRNYGCSNCFNDEKTDSGLMEETE